MIDDKFSQTKERRFQKISSPGGCILQIWDFIGDKRYVPGCRTR
jgi:hypothetical protein